MNLSSSKFIEKVHNNKRFKRLVEMFEQGRFAVDDTAALKEIESLHKTRASRSLQPNDVLTSFQRNTITMSMQNMAFRSRLVEIKMRFFKLHRALDEHIDAMRNYLVTRYTVEFKREFGTVDARRKALDFIMEDFSKKSASFQTVTEMADLVIADIDQTAWGIKAIISAMELTARIEK